jgi:phosphoglycerate dehydrogenase-like enzyme
MLKYIPSKQVTFTLFEIYDKKNDNNIHKGKIVEGKVTSSKIKKNPNKVKKKLRNKEIIVIAEKNAKKGIYHYLNNLKKVEKRVIGLKNIDVASNKENLKK